MVKRDSKGNIETWMCPKCHQETNGYPALSRTDNKTEICSQCGTAEALEQAFKQGLIK